MKELRALNERMTFFKPIATFSNGMYEEDVKRILASYGNEKSIVVGKL